MKENEIKKFVKQKYAGIAQKKIKVKSGCCGPVRNCCDDTYSLMKDEYKEVDGYYKDADLSLGCGIPTEFAQIKSGDIVLDLGSGAGNDCFVARSLTGPEGKVVGLDFTEEMIAKAVENAKKLGFENVEFVMGDIDNMPFGSDSFDVIISNCVLNLVPDKKKAFAEMYRVQKMGGHFSVSDIVLEGELPENIRKDAEMYAGCVSGAIQRTKYLDLIKETGYKKIEILKSKKIELPKEFLIKYITETDIAELMRKDKGIFSITVFGIKE
jgi:ubiquinone/menaquinone biosynthesis C-methylase UbiE